MECLYEILKVCNYQYPRLQKRHLIRDGNLILIGSSDASSSQMLNFYLSYPAEGGQRIINHILSRSYLSDIGMTIPSAELSAASLGSFAFKTLQSELQGRLLYSIYMVDSLAIIWWCLRGSQKLKP